MLTTSQLMKKLGRSRATVLRWAKDKYIPSERRKKGAGRGSPLLFDLTKVEEAMKEKCLTKGRAAK